MSVIVLLKQITMKKLKTFKTVVVYQDLGFNENNKIQIAYYYQINPNTNTANCSILKVLHDRHGKDSFEKIATETISLTDLLKTLNEKIKFVKEDNGIIISDICVVASINEETHMGHRTRTPAKKPTSRKPATRRPAARKPTRK